MADTPHDIPFDLDALRSKPPTTISIALAWQFCDLISRWGIDGTLDMAVQCVRLVKPDITEEDCQEIKMWLEDLKQMFVRPLDRDPKAMALWATYHLLSEGKIHSWAEAAKVAEQITTKPVKPETWRKGMERWVERYGYPKIVLYQRRSGTSDKN